MKKTTLRDIADSLQAVPLEDELLQVSMAEQN